MLTFRVTKGNTFHDKLSKPGMQFCPDQAVNKGNYFSNWNSF